MLSIFSKKNTGYALLITVIIFTLVSVVITFGLTTPIIKQVLLTDDIWGAKQSYYLSEAGAEDVLYRLKSATFTSYVGTSEPITLNGYGATTTLSGSLSGVNGITLQTTSNQQGYDKKIQTIVKQGSGVSFTYGMQVGQGGFQMSGSSGINGNVFSSGDIVGCSSCFITGSAIVSNGSIIEDQHNDSPISSPNSIIFSTSSAVQDVAQSFKVSSTSALTQVSLYLKKVGAPSSNITVKIIKDVSGSPSANAGDVVSSATLSSSLVTTNFDWVDVALSPNPALVVGTTYWIVLDSSTNSSSNYYVVGANLDTNYPNGTSKVGALGSSWSNTGYDMYFRVYLGDFFGSITGGGQYNQLRVGTAGTDMAWAHNISYVSVTGPLRCQNDTLNNKACDQTYSDPSPASYPVSSGNITDWETIAAAGGNISGGYSKTDSSNVTLGPTKITGDLHIGGSVTLTIAGIIYVTGNMTIDGSGQVKLASSYGTNSGIIVVDGQLGIGGSGKATGSGSSGSYIMIVSNSACPTSGSCGGGITLGTNAIEMSGSGGAVILNGQKGTLEFTGSANANEATANTIVMSGATTVTYQSGLANPNFSTGPSGSFNITDWRELNN